MSELGMTWTQSDAEKYLNQQKYYRNAYNDINSQTADLINQLKDIRQAGLQNLYLSEGQNRFIAGTSANQEMDTILANALSSRESLMGANIGSGQRQQGFSDLERYISNAYGSYFQNYVTDKQSIESEIGSDKMALENNYLSNVSTIKKDAAAATQQVDQILQQQAANMVSLSNAPKEYLQYLAEKNPELYNDPLYSKYYNITYEGGSPIYNLKSMEELDSIFYTNGELTDAGKDFYSQMLYGADFEDWLYDNNRELYDWAGSDNGLGDYTDLAGNKTNLANVFGLIGLGEEVKRGVYGKGAITDYGNYQPEKTYKNSKYFGTVDKWTTENGKKLSYLGNLKIGGLDKNDLSNNKNTTFSISYGSGEAGSYATGKIVKNGSIASDDIIKDIKDTVGKIENDKLYVYDKTIYLSDVSDDGTTILREVKLSDTPFIDYSTAIKEGKNMSTAASGVLLSSDKFIEELENEASLSETYNQYVERKQNEYMNEHDLSNVGFEDSVFNLENFIRNSGFFPKDTMKKYNEWVRKEAEKKYHS